MRALSLFSGAGGDTYGLEQAGVTVVGFVEIEDDMIATHLANFPMSQLIGRDVTKVTQAALQPYIDNIDIIFGGFPCQAYSKGGKKDPNDPRAQLFREFVRITSIVRPRWIIGENVKHILKMKTPDNLLVVDVIYQAFRQIGYTMAEPRVLKAVDFGVPQLRERCFFVGHRNGAMFDWRLTLDHPRRKLNTVLQQSLDNALEITAEQVARYQIARFVEFHTEPIVTGRPPTNLVKCVANATLSFGKRVSPAHSEIVDPDGYAKTLICTYSRMPRLFVAMRAGPRVFLRPFTITEAKMIQGFPFNYQITGSSSSAIKQIGNAVPPQFVQKIVERIREL